MNVLLIHGLERTPLSLFNLEQRLQESGHTTEQFGCTVFMESYDRIVERIRVRLQTLSQQGNYGVVTHSLGVS